MKNAGNLIGTFIVSIAQFIIGVLLIADKASLHTIGWYYIFSSSFLTFIALITAVAISIKGDTK